MHTGDTKCPSLFKTPKALENPEVTQGHNHPVDNDRRVVEKCRKDMKQKSHDTNDRPIQTLTNAMATVPDEVKAHIS